MHQNIKLQYRSTVNTNQIKSIILLQNTRSVQEMESLPVKNAFVILYVFVLKATKNTTLKRHKKLLK